MKRVLEVTLAVGAVLSGAGQTAFAQAPAAPVVASPWSATVYAGAGSVERVGGLAGAQVSRRITASVDATVRSEWIQDTVSRRRVSMATTLAAFTASSRNVTMVGDVSAPAWVAMAGVQWRARDDRWTPVVAVDAGMAHVTFRPAFSVAGADVTTQLESYGITLGKDLTGSSVNAAFGVGAGVLIPGDRLNLDARLRLQQFATPAESTRVLSLTVGARFSF